MGLALAGCAASPASAPAPEPPVLIFFVGAECPVSSAYAPEIRRLGEAWIARGGRVWLVYAEPGLELRDAEAHALKHDLPGTIILDVPRSLAGAHGVSRVPTAVVPGVYRGRIDDRYSPEGRRLDSARRHDLEETLNALAVGRPPAPRETPVVGRPLP